MLTLSSSSAWAADPAQEAAASALFEEGRHLSKAGDWPHALAKFTEANRIQSTPGTLLNVGDCLEHLGKIASAWGSFREAERNARLLNDNRLDEARRRADALEGRLARLSIVVPQAARLPGLEVRRDGDLVGEGQWGSAVPADAGPHTVEITAPGYERWSTVVTIARDGAAASVEVPTLNPAPGAGPFAWTPQRIAGVAVGGAGALGLVAGGVLGGLAISKNNASKAECVPGHPDVCPSAGVSDRETAGKLANASTGALIGGGAALVAGIVVFVTARPGSGSGSRSGWRGIEVSPAVGPGLAGLSFHGGW